MLQHYSYILTGPSDCDALQTTDTSSNLLLWADTSIYTGTLSHPHFFANCGTYGTEHLFGLTYCENQSLGKMSDKKGKQVVREGVNERGNHYKKYADGAFAYKNMSKYLTNTLIQTVNFA